MPSGVVCVASALSAARLPSHDAYAPLQAFAFALAAMLPACFWMHTAMRQQLRFVLSRAMASVPTAQLI